MSRQPIAALSVGLRIEGRPVLVVGGGRIAARKAQPLVVKGAIVHVVAPDICEAMENVGVSSISRRPFCSEDLDGVWYVVTATGDPVVDGAVFDGAEQRRIFCNAADDPAHCSVILPAVLSNGDVTIAISTGGRSPASASWLRREIEAVVDNDAVVVARIAAEVRDRVMAAGIATEVPGWAEVLDGEARQLVAAGRPEVLERRLWEAVVGQ